MKRNLIILSLVITLFSCSNSDENSPTPDNTNKVLLLKVDYLTNEFEGGKELSFDTEVSSMTVSNQYVQPSDFGSITLTYAELGETLFDGTIFWNGTGQMNFPQNLLQANQFERVLTADYIVPASGFENVFNPDTTNYDYDPVWLPVQGLVKVREYLQSNPLATVKLFLYTPSVGIGNPEEWDWIIIMKN
ncbi:MAG: hypothetical protein J0L86_11775 [Flavobacteriales bacterium]|nr:hypothetical protein [Flavobacteriales bacterium]